MFLIGKKKSFTLAEVLVTLTIIGVIASITIPSLQSSIQEAQHIAALKKSYNTLEQASRRALIDLGGSFYGEFDGQNHDKLKNTFLKYLNGAKSCDVGTSCFVLRRKFVNGDYIGDFISSQSGLILADGTNITFRAYDSCDVGIDGFDTRDKVCAKIFFDVNGEKMPNMVGKDVFRVWVLKDRIAPSGSSIFTFEGYPGCECKEKYCGFTCTAKYLYSK